MKSPILFETSLQLLQRAYEAKEFQAREAIYSLNLEEAQGYIFKDIFAAINEYEEGNSDEFLEKHMINKKEEFTHLDERTEKFFQKIITPIIEEFILHPSEKLNYLEMSTKHEGFISDFIKAKAIGHVKNLMAHFDKQNFSIINRMIEG